MAGLKHLVECHCVLRIFNREDDVYNHKFPVYSKIDEFGKIIPKLAKCNNCQSLHYVHDYCKSDLRGGKDESSITLSIDDLTLSMPDKLVMTLSKLSCDISTWEHCLDIIEENRWGEHVVLSRDVIDENEHVKILFINSENKFKIENKTINTLITKLESSSGQ
jgi:hypothetical protein